MADKKKAGGDAPAKDIKDTKSEKKVNVKDKKEDAKDKKGDAKDKKGEAKDKKGDAKDKKGDAKEKKGDAKDKKGKDKDVDKGRKDRKHIGEKGGTDKKMPVTEPEIEEVPKTPSAIARDLATARAEQRANRWRKRYPSITKVKIFTRPWRPPPPPQRLPPVNIELPPLETRPWIPPYRRRRGPRPKLPRAKPEEITQPLNYETKTLKKMWAHFTQVEKNKMMLQGSVGCNSKRYSSTTCGSQTACIAVVCATVLSEKKPDQLLRSDVDTIIEFGDRYYKQCITSMKCYKGKPALELNQLMPSFFLFDMKYTVRMTEVDRGLLAKHPDSDIVGQDLFKMMEKRVGTTYAFVLSVGDKHFYVWGNPPEGSSGVQTICYIFDPHMLDEVGLPNKINGAAAFLRYAGVSSFTIDFLANYGDLDPQKRLEPKPRVILTKIEVMQKEPLERIPLYELDLKTLKIHCKSERECMQYNALMEQKMKMGQYPLASLSAVSLATSRAGGRRRVKEYYQRLPKDPDPEAPVPPEEPPAPLTDAEVMALRGENFFLYCPKGDAHTFGRDDLVPLPPSQTVLHSLVDVADQNFHSQYKQLGEGKWMLVSTRHMASRRYQTFKIYTSIACCVAAIAMLRRLRARGWNEDTLDETLDVGYNLYRESLLERGGPIRRLVLGELKEVFPIRDKEYIQRHRGIAVWGKLISNNPLVFDLCRGIENFFLEADTGVLQVPGEIETAIWNEGGKYYLYHPWPADKSGHRVGIREGGKACILYFDTVQRLCDYFMENVNDMRRKPFSIADVMVWERPKMPDPVNEFKTVDTNRWVVQGSFHERDMRFAEEHRGKQDTPISIAAIAMSRIVEPPDWTKENVDETLLRGDMLYKSTLDHLERLGINIDSEEVKEEEGEQEEEHQGPSSTMAAVDVLNRFKVTDEDCIEADIMDSQFKGTIQGDRSAQPPQMSLRESLRALFRDDPNAAAVLTARGGSMALWFSQDHYYFFDPQGCDKNGYPSDDPRAAACLIRVEGTSDDLADTIESNLSPGPDDNFNLSPVSIIETKFNQPINAPEIRLESNAYEWIAKGTAAIMMGPRGQNTAIGKAADRAGIGPEDMAGRNIALPAAAAFCAATESVPPPHMHQDHMFNFLDAGAEYYLHHFKKTQRKDIEPEDLTEKFEMGANTFSIELGEPIRLPLRFPDEVVGEGGGGGDELGEGEEAPPKGITQIKEQLAAIWDDTTKPTTVHLLVGDYHQIGIWMAAGGKVVVFDPAPTLYRGALTSQRIKRGDELRLQRLRDEMTGEDAFDDEDVADEGGEEKPEEIEFVPPESTPVLWVAASPGEFIDKLVKQGPLDAKQMIAPYKLYPVKVTNELTSVLHDRIPAAAAPPGEEEAAEDEGDESGEGQLIPELDEAAIGAHMMRVGRSVASVRGRVAQNEAYFLDHPNRDHQDAAMAVMGIVVNSIEPYTYWKPELIDAILKYGDRLYTMSLPKAKKPPNVTPEEVVSDFHVTHFDVHIDVTPAVVSGDIKAGDTGPVLNIRRGIAAFFEEHSEGVLCAKNYCVGLWRAADGNAFCYWEAHCIGPRGRVSSPSGAATLVVFSTSDEMAEIYRCNVERLCRPGNNRFYIADVKVSWEFAKTLPPVTDMSAFPDGGYEFKILTAYVEVAKGRTILRGSQPPDLAKFTRDSVLQSACSAIVGACMTYIRQPHLWSRKTMDEIMSVALQLFCASISALGYEFRPGEDVLLPLQVLKRYVLGINYVKYELQQIFSGRLEPAKHADMNVKMAIEKFFEQFTTGLLWSAPHAVSIWRVRNPPVYYMLDPHACGALGLRKDAADDGAACVMTFTSAKLLAHAFLQNYPMTDRARIEFILYALAVNVHPIKPLGKRDPPLVRGPRGAKLVSATSKVYCDGTFRRADEDDRQHPPGSATCFDAQRASDKRDKDNCKYKGQRNTAGWLILTDNTQYCSAFHSMTCRRYSCASRGYQALPCCVMAVAMSRVEDVCRWCAPTLDSILDSGDQLYQDSVLHFKPKTKYLPIEQILRKFYTPGNCVCRVVVYKHRQEGLLETDLMTQMIDFFREERAGVFVTGRGDIAVALFRNQRGYFMFDPADRDRYGRAVAPPCTGKARACLSCYPTVKSLVEKLGANIPPCYKKEEKHDDGITVLADKSKKIVSEAVSKTNNSEEDTLTSESDDDLEEATTFKIYGMDVTNLRHLNKNEK